MRLRHYLSYLIETRKSTIVVILLRKEREVLKVRNLWIFMLVLLFGCDSTLPVCPDIDSRTDGVSPISLRAMIVPSYYTRNKEVVGPFNFEIRPCSEQVSSSYDESEAKQRYAFSNEFSSIVVVNNQLFVDRQSYGEVPLGASILVGEGLVFVDDIERHGAEIIDATQYASYQGVEYWELNSYNWYKRCFETQRPYSIYDRCNDPTWLSKVLLSGYILTLAEVEQTEEGAVISPITVALNLGGDDIESVGYAAFHYSWMKSEFFDRESLGGNEIRLVKLRADELGRRLGSGKSIAFVIRGNTYLVDAESVDSLIKEKGVRRRVL